MDLAFLLDSLGESESLAAVAPYWDESLKSFPLGGLPCLDGRNLREWRSWCGLEPELDGDLAAAAAGIAARDGLPQLLHHLSRRLSAYPDGASFDAWPLFQNSLGDAAGLFYLIGALSIVPEVRAVHVRLGVPEEVTRDTLRQVACFCGNYRRDFGGRSGILRGQFFWLDLYVKGRLFRLGRLEYKLERNPEGICVFRNRRNGAVTALLRGGLTLRPDGFVAGAAGVAGVAADPVSADPADQAASGSPAARPPAAATTTLDLGPDHAAGYPVGPDGRAALAPVRLDYSEWELLLGPADEVLDMHIPAGGNMDVGACMDSFRRAFAFFAARFPVARPRAVVCSSWIFNPALQEILPGTSNLVLLQRAVRLHPIPSDPQDGLFFIFGTDTDPATRPRTTSLQRAVHDYLQAGNEWRGGGMYLLADELPTAPAAPTPTA